MASTSPPVTPTLNVLSSIPDPTAQWGSPATRVQIQNASPFILEITADGEQWTIQSFTAQTIPTGGTGTTLTILPTAGPAGSQGSILAVWLVGTQAPPMTDGQLTGAATYAQGLGSLAGSTSWLDSSGPFILNGVAIPPTTRTLVVVVDNTALVSTIKVIGGQTGYVYYNSFPYLTNSPGNTTKCLVVVPFASLVDSTVNVTAYAGGPAGAGSLSVYADTAQYDESVFYNGTSLAASAAVGAVGTYTILTGPARMLAVSLTTTSAVDAYIFQTSSGRYLQSSTGGQTAFTFPPNTILPAGSELQMTLDAGTGSAIGNVIYAYP